MPNISGECESWLGPQGTRSNSVSRCREMEYSLAGQTTVTMAKMGGSRSSRIDSRKCKLQETVVLPGRPAPAPTGRGYHCEAPVRGALLHSQTTTNKNGIHKIRKISISKGRSSRQPANHDGCETTHIVFSRHAWHVPCTGVDISCAPLRLLSRGDAAEGGCKDICFVQLHDIDVRRSGSQTHTHRCVKLSKWMSEPMPPVYLAQV